MAETPRGRVAGPEEAFRSSGGPQKLRSTGQPRMGATAQAAAREVPRLGEDRRVPGWTSIYSRQTLPPSGSGPHSSGGGLHPPPPKCLGGGAVITSLQIWGGSARPPSFRPKRGGRSTTAGCFLAPLPLQAAGRKAAGLALGTRNGCPCPWPGCGLKVGYGSVGRPGTALPPQVSTRRREPPRWATFGEGASRGPGRRRLAETCRPRRTEVNPQRRNSQHRDPGVLAEALRLARGAWWVPPRLPRESSTEQGLEGAEAGKRRASSSPQPTAASLSEFQRGGAPMALGVPDLAPGLPALVAKALPALLGFSPAAASAASDHRERRKHPQSRLLRGARTGGPIRQRLRGDAPAAPGLRLRPREQRTESVSHAFSLHPRPLKSRQRMPLRVCAEPEPSAHPAPRGAGTSRRAHPRGRPPALREQLRSTARTSPAAPRSIAQRRWHGGPAERCPRGRASPLLLPNPAELRLPWRKGAQGAGTLLHRAQPHDLCSPGKPTHPTEDSARARPGAAPHWWDRPPPRRAGFQGAPLPSARPRLWDQAADLASTHPSNRSFADVSRSLGRVGVLVPMNTNEPVFTLEKEQLLVEMWHL
ncbi:uncharacterized protein LOC115297810 [Suricata suricatta]|uniref:uncharacterized protein LOC115297810 n=1 Tax=Suricata suricatta TaxID=37032 RepID=UPI0011554EAD|nr:uncharacterized protein LOC115297810 [Suricata suricatta]